MHTTTFLFATLLGGALLPAHAAVATPPDPARFTGPLLPMHGKAVKNAPYSAEAVSEQLQRLADGNEISRTSTTMNYRDSAGRTRQEIRDADGELRTVTLYHPAERVTWFLNPRQKSANKLADPLAPAAPPQRRAEPGDEVIVKGVERSEGDANKQFQEKVRILADKLPAARIGAAMEGAFGDMRWATQASTRELGSKEIEGIKVNGKLRTYEIPAGEIGNRNAIVVSQESWYAPDLKVTMYTKRTDPRSGERVYRLTNIKREEPPAALFVVPPEYTVKDVLAGRAKAAPGNR
jgi:hypothetical protein